MFDLAQIVRWISQRWRSAGSARKVGYGIVAALLVVGAAFFAQVIPGFDTFKDLFAKARPEVQTAVLSVLAVGAVAAAVWGIMRNTRVTELKGEVDSLKVRLSAAEGEVRGHQERLNRLLDVESRSGLWQRPCVIKVPDFVPKSHRKTRFLTVLNLKGGVGKTTLTANLAACLALANPPKRVLVIDVDFQGTLGNATVEVDLLNNQIQHDATVSKLLRSERHEAGAVERLATPMNQVPNAKVVIARDILDLDDFHLLARFFIDATADPRFRFRLHLQQQEVFDTYDLVIFDCPPRVTTSVVNAMMCSDFVVIPTRLDRGSIDAVPRTIGWMKSLGVLCHAELIGVVANHVAARDGTFATKADRLSYDYLREAVKSESGGDHVLKAVVTSTPRAVSTAEGLVASVNPGNQVVFHPFVMELVRRMNR